MTAEQFSPQTKPKTNDSTAANGGGGTNRRLAIVTEATPSRGKPAERLGEHHRKVLKNFSEYFAEVTGTELDQVSPEQAPDIAHAVHAYAHDLGSKRVQAIREANKPVVVSGVQFAPKHFIEIPMDSITQRINRYYQQFGTNRRQKSPQVAAKENQFLARKEPVYGRLQVRDRQDAPVYREHLFPELHYEIELAHVLELAGNQTAADAAETVLAAHGDRILGFASMAGKQLRHYRSTGLVRRIDPNTIPVGFEAETSYRSHD